MVTPESPGETDPYTVRGGAEYSGSKVSDCSVPPISSTAPSWAADDHRPTGEALIVLARLLGRQAARQHRRRPGHSTLRIAALLMAVSIAVAVALLMLRVRGGG
jgi:hypothetical protein